MIALLALVSACGGEAGPDAGAPDNARGSADAADAGAAGQGAGIPAAIEANGYNLLLITLDTTRADHLPAYGYGAVDTPAIDRLAAEGARFEHVTSTVPATLPAHASIMTGLLPFQSGVRNNGTFVLGADAVTLAEVLHGAGYSTGGFIAAVVLASQFGMAQGFDHFDGLDRYQAETGDESGQRPGDAVLEPAEAWIRQQSGRWFAWVHLYDPHSPYEPPEPYASRYADAPYDGEIAYTDDVVGRLRRVLEETGAAGNTLIVLTADHGEGLGDHGEDGHAYFIYDSTMHVPLILWAPGVVPAGVVARGGASVVDIYPTVLSLLGVAAPPALGAAGDPDLGGGVTGVDLTPRLTDPDAAGTAAYAESLIPYLDMGWSELRALVDGNYKYIAAPEPELYDLAADPGETDNLVDVDVERADAMAEQLAALVEGDDVTAVTGAAVDPDNVAALQALGYLAGGGVARDRRDIDPKDMVEAYTSFIGGLEDVDAALADGRYGDANDILVRLDQLMPDNYLIYYSFGQLATEAGDPATAVGVLERSLELNPSYLPTYTELANALNDSGDPSGARDLIAQALKMFPDNFALTLLDGAIAHDSGDLDAALAAYRVAERLEPDNPRLLERMGHLFLLRQQPADAVAALRHLVEVTPGNAAGWAQLAIALAQSGDVPGAQAALQRAVDLDPNDPLVQQIMQQFR
ncbi:MAG: sulfatase-like hydrolase/transferase [Acidobacteriota bacterium]